jgi:hypothetical protein
VVLVSKADLLADRDVERAVEYVRRELCAALGTSETIDVRAVSTAPGAEVRLDAFRRDVLEPLASDHSRAAARALVERVRQLVRATAVALGGRTSRGNERVMRVQRARSTAMAAIRAEVDRTDGAAQEVLDAAAAAVFDAWRREEDGDVAARRAIVQAAGDALGRVRAAVDAARAAAGMAATDGRRLPPLFDPELLDALPALVRPPLARRLIGRAVAARRLAPVAEPLAQAPQRYASRLYAWGSGAIDELVSASWEVSTAEAGAPLPPELARVEQLLNDAFPGALTPTKEAPSSAR